MVGFYGIYTVHGTKDDILISDKYIINIISIDSIANESGFFNVIRTWKRHFISPRFLSDALSHKANGAGELTSYVLQPGI